MRAFSAALLTLLAGLTVAAVVLDLPYWLLRPEQKFARSWRDDLALLEKTGHFPAAWKDLREVEFSSNESRVQEWYQKTHSPFTIRENGKFKLQILALYQIDRDRYGVMLQYNWIDLASGNTIGELGRTLKLGIVY